MLALDVTPIGTAMYDVMSLDYLSSYSSQPQLLGRSEQPNIEGIFSLKPDLIVGDEFTGEAIFDKLSQIAPTALGPWEGYSSWREYFDFVARTLGKEDKAEAVWAGYEQHISEIKKSLDAQLKDPKVTAIYAYGDGMTIDAENSFVGSIFTDLGLRQPDYATTEDGTISLSEELIPTIDADFLFVSVYNLESEKILAEWEQKPLWNQLQAVQAGQVYVVDANVWRGGNPIAADLVLDDLFTYLVKESA